jgi:hypothetical protein
MSTHQSRRPGRLATGLGVFSLGLGAVQLVAPGRLNRAIGLRDDRVSRFWQRVVGAQELSAAAGILGPPPTQPFLWERTAGDVLHLSMLARAATRRAERPARVLGAMAGVAGCLGADAYASVLATRNGSQPVTRGKATITVGDSRESVMQAWSAFEDQPPGEVVFRDAPGGRGTEIHVTVEDQAPAGPLGGAVRKVTGDDPLQVARDALRRFKQLVETGEIARSDGAPGGHSARAQPKQRPAQPVEA